MKFAAPLVLFASPALAHSGAHMHPHGVEGWVVGLAIIAVAGTIAAVARARK